MKSLLSALVFVFGLPAFASGLITPLQSDDIGLSPLKGQVLNVDHLVCALDDVRTCPPTSIVKIQFFLGGCMDRLGPTSSRYERKPDGSVDIYVSALNIHNKKSLYVDCFRIPTAEMNIYVHGDYITEKDVRVHYLGNYEIHYPQPTPILPMDEVE